MYAPPNLHLKCWIKCQTRAVQCLAWRAYDFSQDHGSSHSERLFAVASNDNTACVFNVQEVFSSSQEDSPQKAFEPLELVSSFITFKGHGKVISLAWSPHNPDLIISCSFDKTSAVSFNCMKPLCSYIKSLELDK